MVSRLHERAVKHHEEQRLANLTLQMETTGELHGVAGPKAMAERPRVCRDRRGELDDYQGAIVPTLEHGVK